MWTVSKKRSPEQTLINNILQCLQFKLVNSVLFLLQYDHIVPSPLRTIAFYFYGRPYSELRSGPNDIAAEAERETDRKWKKPKCFTHTNSAMLTQNTTVAPDRHKRAHLLVTGKYGSIS